MTVRRISLVVLACALLAALVSPGVAVAGKAESQIELTGADHDPAAGSATYHGRVRSDRERCKRNRKVRLYHNGVLIGEARTDDRGRFKIVGPVPPSGDNVVAKLKANRRCEGHRTKEPIDELLY